jgi:hypothetical protein
VLLSFAVATLSQFLSLPEEACQREEERRRTLFACTRLTVSLSFLSAISLFDSDISIMGLNIYHFGCSPFLCLLVYIPLVLQFHSAAASLTINFSQTPKAFSNSATATFAFDVRDTNSGLFCFNCDIKCQVCFFHLLAFMNVLTMLVGASFLISFFISLLPNGVK